MRQMRGFSDCVMRLNTALAGGVAALEDDHDLQAFVFDPLLEFHQFDLQFCEGLLVFFLGDLLYGSGLALLLFPGLALRVSLLLGHGLAPI